MHSRQFILFFQEQNAWSGHNLFYDPKRTLWPTWYYSLTVRNWYWRHSSFSNTLSYFSPGQPSFFNQFPQHPLHSALCLPITQTLSFVYHKSASLCGASSGAQQWVTWEKAKRVNSWVSGAGSTVPSEPGLRVFRGSGFCQDCCHLQAPLVLK